ncbi:MAG: hypothetical protein LKJ88_07430 [Bacilli bacterium]|nr:hypothetical protein [Bacilli bacterium]
MGWLVRKPKIASKDFSPLNLPKTRKEVFQDVLKHHWLNLLLLGLMSFLFVSPLIISRLYLFIVRGNVSQALAQGSLTQEDASLAWLNLSNLFSLINIPLYLILGIGMAGIMRIIKRYSFLDNVSFKEDFALGIKQNIWQYLLLFLLFGLIAFIADYVENLSTTISASGEVYSYLGVIPRVVALLLMYPIFAYSLVAVSIYTNKFFQQTKVGLICYLSKFWLSLPMLALCSLPLIVTLIRNFYCYLIGGILSGILLPFMLLGWFCWTMKILDEKFNPGRYPDLVNRGLLGLQAEADPELKKLEENRQKAKAGGEEYKRELEEQKASHPETIKSSEEAVKPPISPPPIKAIKKKGGGSKKKTKQTDEQTTNGSN